MKRSYITSVLIATLVVTMLSLSLDYFFGTALTPNYILWAIVSNLLTILVLGTIVKYSVYHSFRLTFHLFLVMFLIGQFNLLIEAYIFNVTDRWHTTALLIQGFIFCVLSASALVLIFGKWNAPGYTLRFDKRRMTSWFWRLVLGDLLYIFFYLLAGFVLYSVYPQLMDFYQDKIPPFELMIQMQFFRGGIFLLIALLLCRTLKLKLWQRALVIGLVFSILGGIAPLLMPGDQVMPAYIKFGHIFEVGISNFLYGITLAYLLGHKLDEEKQEFKTGTVPINS